MAFGMLIVVKPPQNWNAWLEMLRIEFGITTLFSSGQLWKMPEGKTSRPCGRVADCKFVQLPKINPPKVLMLGESTRLHSLVGNHWGWHLVAND